MKATLNTREREVKSMFDELVSLARIMAGEADVEQRASRYMYLRGFEDRVTALLAEGSASSEGAEAVGRTVWLSRYDLDGWDQSGSGSAPIDAYRECGAWKPGYVCFREVTTHPQPAQGEPESGLRDAYEGAREDLLDWKGRAQRAEARLRNLGWAGVDASEPSSGEHEQRSCEGSNYPEAQQAQSWLAVVSVLNEVAPAWQYAISGTGCEKACAAIRALAQRCEGSERRPIADEVLDAAVKIYHFAPGEAKHREQLRAVLEWYESAHPRGLPAAWLGRDGELSYVKRNHDDEPVGARAGALIASTQWERGLPAGSDAYSTPMPDTGTHFPYQCDNCGKTVHAHLAPSYLCPTADQPSCGQDARDAARYQWLKENAHAGFMQSGRSWAVLSSSTEFRTWEQCDAAIDAAIAAQQLPRHRPTQGAAMNNDNQARELVRDQRDFIVTHLSALLTRDDKARAVSMRHRADAYLAMPAGSTERPTRDREADRARFTDAGFNRWLDDGISDAGHTVYDAIPDIACAWQGWTAREYYEQPATTAPGEGSVSEQDAAQDAVESAHALIGVMFGRADGSVPETFNTPIGVPVKVGSIFRDLTAVLESFAKRRAAKGGSHE